MHRCLTNYRARGLSLIEVVVGMAILGTFLTFIFIAQARLTKQSVIVRKKAQVIAAVDQLLTTWALDWESLPTEDTGTLPPPAPGSSDSEISGASGASGGGDFQWTTRVIDTPQFTKLGLQKVELTVIDTSIINSTEPLLKMELAVIPLPPEPPAPEASKSSKATSSTSRTSGTNRKQAQGATP